MSYCLSIIKRTKGKMFCNRNISFIDLMCITASASKMAYEKLMAERGCSEETARKFVLEEINKSFDLID